MSFGRDWNIALRVYRFGAYNIFLIAS